MTSETFITRGVLMPAKPALGQLVREFASHLGEGHLLAQVEWDGKCFVAPHAEAYPLRARWFDCRARLEAFLNKPANIDAIRFA